MKKKWSHTFFLLKKKHHWFIVPALVFFYNKNTFFETGVYTPSWGVAIRWLIFMAGVQVQREYK